MNRPSAGSTRLLAPFLARHWRALATSVISTVVLTAAQLAQPWPLKIVIDRLLGPHRGAFDPSSADLVLLGSVAALVLAVAAVGAAAQYWSDVLLNRAGERIVHDLRTAVYAHLQRLSLGFHQVRSKGDLVTRVTGDVNAVGALFSDSLGEIVSAVLLLVGMAVVSFVLDPVLALATFAVTPLLGFVTFRYRRRIKELARRQRAEEGEIASLAGEALSSIQVVKAFGSEEYEHERVEARSEVRRRIGVDAARAEARFSAVVDLLGALAATFVLLLGAFRVASGALTAGSLVVFAAYAARTYKPLRDLARQSAAVSRAAARADRIAELLASDDALRDRPGAYTGVRAAGKVELDAVSFAYASGRPALAGVTLTIEPGERVAIVGRSGAGKSTLAALLARFYDPDSGVIRLDDRDARACSLSWFRAQIGMLLQDTVLFRGTVAENIAYGSRASREAVVAAARAAGADEFVSALPDGYETELGAAGAGLSGGQRQRLGIARVLVRNPPVLILDEPTTGLDAASEAQLVSALERLMEGRTTLIVTHSIALARRAHRVLVVDRGRVVEDGTPAELLAAGGAFSSLAAHGRTGAARLREARLPQLGTLLDPDAAAEMLARTLRPTSELRYVVPRTVRYKPGRRVVVTYEAEVDGVRRDAVAIADTKRDLAALAGDDSNVADARRVNGRSPAPLPLRFDARTSALVQWAPYDLELPLLREPASGLASRLAALGLDTSGDEPRRLGYKPFGRVVLAAGPTVVKGYAARAKLHAALRGFRLAERTEVRAAPCAACLDDLRATVQRALPGLVAGDDAGLAPTAGLLLRAIHESSLEDLALVGRAEQLRAAAEAADVVAAVLPVLAPRVERLVHALERSLPPDGRLVASHGDFEVGQLLVHGDEVALLDFDEACAAPRARDVATYAAHAARRGGSQAALTVAEDLVAAYGRRPEGLAAYLSASVLVRAEAPFRKLEDDWPERVEALVLAAEEALDA